MLCSLSARLDHLRICVLAEEVGEGLGSSRRHHGEEDTLRASLNLSQMSNVLMNVE